MGENLGRDAQKRLAQLMGTDETTLESPFKAMRQGGQYLLRNWLVAFTEDEREFAVWLIERNKQAEKLQQKAMGSFLKNITKSIIVILWWHLKNILHIKQRDIGGRDPNRPWNEKHHDYDNDWYRHLDETGRLQVELFGGLTPEQRHHVESVIHMFDNDVFFSWGCAVEFGERISNRYVEERRVLLKEWLENPQGEPPIP